MSGPYPLLGPDLLGPGRGLAAVQSVSLLRPPVSGPADSRCTGAAHAHAAHAEHAAVQAPPWLTVPPLGVRAPVISPVPASHSTVCLRPWRLPPSLEAGVQRKTANPFFLTKRSGGEFVAPSTELGVFLNAD